MKYILVGIPGAADQPAAEIGEKTPFEVAKIPTMHAFAKMGKVGKVKLTSDRLPAVSDVALLNLLGYEAEKIYTGRGPLEAANLELSLEENEIPFRMNFITEWDGTLADPTAGKISTKEAKALINYLNKKVSSDFVRFFSGAGHRHVAVIKDSHGYDALSAKTESPDTITGEPLDDCLPEGPGEELLKKLMYDAKLLLQDHEINQVRVDLNENPANMIWLWGQGRRPQMEKLSETIGMPGALIADAEYAKGIGRLAGLTVFETQYAPGEEEARYDKIGDVLIETLAEKDFVCVYLDGCDEASRVGDLKAKISALEGIDFFILSKVKEYLEKEKDVRVLLTPCCEMPWSLGQATQSPVPFTVVGKNVMADDVERFTEAASEASTLYVGKGHELIQGFLAK